MAILIMYVGMILGFGILALVGDYFGRKLILVVGLIAGIGGLMLTIFAGSIYVAAVGLLIALLGIQWANAICSMYIS